MFDYGTTYLGIVHGKLSTGNAAAVSSGQTCMSEKTAMAGPAHIVFR
jgi:hypothetical protein